VAVPRASPGWGDPFGGGDGQGSGSSRMALYGSGSRAGKLDGDNACLRVTAASSGQEALWSTHGTRGGGIGGRPWPGTAIVSGAPEVEDEIWRLSHGLLAMDGDSTRRGLKEVAVVDDDTAGERQLRAASSGTTRRLLCSPGRRSPAMRYVVKRGATVGGGATSLCPGCR
jgi:hypothetical protein